jgi:hypothetical protein
VTDRLGAGLVPLLAPPYERHYFPALRYEALGHLHEARAEWQAYAAAGDDARYRRRARAHVAAIDALLAERTLRPPAPPPAPPPPPARTP